MTDEQQRQVWLAMGDQFLDTETRAWIPALAEQCLRYGLSIDEARAMWRYEVAPVVCFNLWDIVGAWGGWDGEWLAAAIDERRRRGATRPTRLRTLAYWIRSWLAESSWRAVARCMTALAAVPPASRPALTATFTWFASVYFDTGDVPPRPGVDVVVLQHLFESGFLPVFSPCVVGGDGESPDRCRERVHAALRTG